MTRSPHEVLGVAVGASPAQLVEARRRRLFELHPDRQPAARKAEAEAACREVDEAFVRLTAPPSLLHELVFVAGDAVAQHVRAEVERKVAELRGVTLGELGAKLWQHLTS